MKPTQIELKNRAALVAEMLSQGLTRTQIHRACEQQWGVDWRTTDRYVNRAKTLLQAEIEQDKPILTAVSAGFYNSMIRKATATDKDKLVARQRLDALMGLDAPTRQEIAGAGGGALSTVHVFIPHNRRDAMPFEVGGPPEEQAQLGNGNGANGKANPET